MALQKKKLTGQELMATIAAEDAGATRASKAMSVNIPPLDIHSFDLVLVGDTPLVMHKWDTKTLTAILDDMTGKAKAKKLPKDPDGEFEAATYYHESHTAAKPVYGFPAVAFKAAAVDAAVACGMFKTDARRAFHVIGQGADSLVPIYGERARRMDPVKVKMSMDLRFRPQIMPWRAVLRIRHNPRLLTVEQIVNLFNNAGFSTGVGEWRNEKDGLFGMFHCATEGE